jgi:hypothetical protein
MDVSAEAVPFPQQLQHLDQIVHDLDWAAGDAGGDEQALAPPSLLRAQEDADQLLRFEQSTWHGPVPAHGAVVAVVAARVGHEDAKQRHPHSWSRTKVPDIERPKRPGILRVPETRGEALPIICGKRH